MALPGALTDRAMIRLRAIGGVFFLAVFTFYVWDTLRWPMIWDTPIMHYVRFLITRGFKPYSQITDMNLPGCYLAEGWGMAVFGWSDLSWRVYEFFLMGVLAVAGMVLGGRRNWFAGIFAATIFVVMHGSEGPRVATERDELMAILLILAAALTVLAARRMQPAWMFAVGFAAGLATSIKPAALLMDAGLLTLIVWQQRQRKQPCAAYVWWMLAGNAAISAVVLSYLLRNDAIQPLWFILTKIVPNYAKLVQPGAAYMVRHLLPAAIVPLLLAGVIAWLQQRRPQERKHIRLEQAAILLGIGVGAVSYFMQAKGLTYHRYSVVLFVLLWIGWELCEAMHRERSGARATAVAGVLLLFLVIVPYYARLMLQSPRGAQALSPMAFQLQADLTHLGGDKLQRQVLCLDMIDGCFDALYHMRLVQNTGATGDTLLFAPTRDFAVDYYRHWFLDRDREHPANVVVLVNEWYQDNEVPSFDKLNAWPQYATYLRDNYEPVIERKFGPDTSSPAYRLYLRKGSNVMRGEQASPLR
jgi:4-amino-4-deoxy-L-arabinose transferase-like glycosyltransferase